MAAKTTDPVREFEHSHERLTQLARDVGRLLPGPREPVPDRLFARLEALRDELLAHFAKEEEGLFPFLRATLPAQAERVDRLALAHDAVCGVVVRMAHLAETAEGPEGRAALASLHDRFQAAYAEHSRDEAALLADVARSLDVDQRGRLAELLRGI